MKPLFSWIKGVGTTVFLIVGAILIFSFIDKYDILVQLVGAAVVIIVILIFCVIIFYNVYNMIKTWYNPPKRTDTDE